jgi:hypothetical protein
MTRAGLELHPALHLSFHGFAHAHAAGIFSGARGRKSRPT